MNSLFRGGVLFVAASILTLCYVPGIFAGTEDSATDSPESSAPDMEIKDGKVREWRNPKLTELTRLPDFARAAATAEDEPVLIFKHSTTCPISGSAAQRIDKMLRDSDEPLPTFFMVKVRESRPVSNAIEAQYEVKHESPQILLLKDGKAVWNTSHDDITADAVLEAIEKFDAKPPVKSSDQD